MRNVLVTGGAGFIGSNFVRFILQAEPEARIINLDALTYAGNLDNLKDLPHPERHTFVHGDICDRPFLDKLLRHWQIDTVVHFAAETHVDRSIVGPGQFIQTNIIGTFTLLEAVRQFWLEEKSLKGAPVRFHHVSTDEVYGSLDPDAPAWTENTPYAPNSPYAASKAASDHLVRSYGHTYGLPYTISNCTNNYGPYQFPEKLIPLMILNAYRGKPLPIYGDGGQIRDWLFVEDHCEAIWRILSAGKPGQTYNIGGGAQPTNLQVVEQLCGLMDELEPESLFTPHRSLMRFVADRPGHDRRYAIDFQKIQHDLRWQPRHSFGSGLQKTVQWYLDHPDWVDRIFDKGDYQSWMENNYELREGNKP